MKPIEDEIVTLERPGPMSIWFCGQMLTERLSSIDYSVKIGHFYESEEQTCFFHGLEYLSTIDERNWVRVIVKEMNETLKKLGFLVSDEVLLDALSKFLHKHYTWNSSLRGWVPVVQRSDLLKGNVDESADGEEMDVNFSAPVSFEVFSKLRWFSDNYWGIEVIISSKTKTDMMSASIMAPLKSSVADCLSAVVAARMQMTAMFPDLCPGIGARIVEEISKSGRFVVKGSNILKVPNRGQTLSMPVDESVESRISVVLKS
jgi:hypothetical protein